MACREFAFEGATVRVHGEVNPELWREAFGGLWLARERNLKDEDERGRAGEPPSTDRAPGC